ncbi:MAG TPA: dihydropyrimidinase, partial [Anaerolineales bacterium]|nr:dihydropyrimidinase [Anaerolineales bacterium]
LVLPGAVDPHVHIEMPTATTITSETWETGSKAAAFGGTTTVIDFVEPRYPKQPLLESFQERLGQAQGRSAIDFSLHMTLCDSADETLQQIAGAVAAGMPSFKMYTTYPGFHLSDPELLAAFEVIARERGLAMVHAESDAIIQHAVHRLQAAGRLRLSDFPLSRPDAAEKEAVERVLNLARYADVPVYIVHVSTRSGAAAIARARRNGQAVWGETCPQYLLLNADRLRTRDFNGAKFVCCPPLRTDQDRQYLWDCLAEGDLQSVGTDHCAFNFVGQKDMGRDSFLEIPSGLPGIELRLALLYTYGVKSGKLTLEQWADLCCTAPARLFGLYPRKGELVRGADADIVIFDPGYSGGVARASLHENVDYTPYEGMQLAGRAKTTLLRGQVLVREGQWVGDPKGGNFVGGEPFQTNRSSV